MKLNDERLQWILDNLNEFKRAIVTVDFCRKYGIAEDYIKYLEGENDAC